MHSPASRGLRPANESHLVEKLLRSRGSLLDLIEGDPRRGVEVESELIGVVDVLGSDRPWVEIETTELGQADHVGFAARHVHPPRSLRGKPDIDRLEGCVLRRTLVIDRIDRHILHIPLEHRRPTTDPPDGPFGHANEVLDDIELRPPLHGEHNSPRAADPHLLTIDDDGGVVRHVNLRLCWS